MSSICYPLCMPIPIVGRTPELDALRAFVEGLRQEPPKAVLFEGDPGLGKTRLLDHAAAMAEAKGVRVLRSTPIESECELPFAAILQGLGSESRKRVAALLPASPRSATTLQTLILEAVMDELETRTMTGTSLLVMDDLQWADPSSLLVLDRIHRSWSTIPISMVLARRVHPHVSELDMFLRRLDANAQRFALSPLSESDVRVLAESVLGAKPGPGIVRALNSAAGNPLYASELLRAIQRDVIVTSGIADVDNYRVPPSLHDAIRDALAFLPTELLSLLKTASLLGTRFRVDDLAIVVGADVLEIIDDLEPAVDLGVIRFDGSEVAFRHDLVRDSLYATITDARRMVRHRDAARALIAAGHSAASVAHHLLAFAEPGDDEALQWLRHAADGALTEAPALAERLLARAVEVAGPRHPDRFAMETGRAQALLWSGRSTRAEELAKRLLAERPSGIARELLQRVLIESWYVKGRLTESLDQVMELVGENAPAGILARAAGALVQAGDNEQGRTLASEALALSYSTDDPSSRSVALTALARAESNEGRLSSALGHLEQAAALVMGAGGPESALESITILAAFRASGQGRTEEALRLLSDALRVAEQRGQTWGLWLLHFGLGIVQKHVGRLDDAGAALETSVRLANDAGSRVFVPLALANLAHIEALRDDPAKARSYLEKARSLAEGTDPNLATDSDVLWARAVFDELDRNDAAALDSLERLRQQALAAGAPGLLTSYATNLAVPAIRIALRLGDVRLARQALSTVEQGVAIMRDAFPIEPWNSALIALCRSMVEGDALGAVRACDLIRDTDRPHLQAAACEAAGRLLVAAARPDEATELFQEAHSIWNDMGATRKSREMLAELRAIGVPGTYRTDPARPRRGWGALTPTETKVVGLVAQGLTYRAIGERLFISKRTVETHIEHIFRKLGMSTRHEVAAEALRRGIAVSDSISD